MSCRHIGICDLMEMVRAAGLEPAKPKPRDFKSLVFTNFTTPAPAVRLAAQ
jgi:hypothetical protein